jgi:excisionase family DNA binding protein
MLYWKSIRRDGAMLIMEKLLTPEEVAKILDISEYTVKEMLRDGELPGKKVRGKWRVKQEDLRDYINTPEKPEDKK